jgi:hypothetical protein
MWTTSRLNNVRPTHQEAEGQIVSIDEPFMVGGEFLDYPGDEKGSPEEVINCHCIAVALPPEQTGIGLSLGSQRHTPGGVDHDQDTHGGEGGGAGGGSLGDVGADFNEQFSGLFQNGANEKAVSWKVADGPVMAHGTHNDSADSILANGFQESEAGTAGPGVYLTDKAKDALYDKNPALSDAVASHGGKQADTIITAKVSGKIIDVGTYGSKDGPSPYLPPHHLAALAVSNAAGKQVDISDLHHDAKLAGKILEQNGFSGVAWTFGSGRRASVVFSSGNVKALEKHSK